jgi:ketosteroid isomerase-like protein
VSTTPGRKYFDKRFELIKALKIDQLVDETYTEDALLVDLMGGATVRGRDALKKHFNQHFPMMGSVELKAIDKIVESDDALMIEMTVNTGAWGTVSSHEGFVLRDGKASYHFTAPK